MSLRTRMNGFTAWVNLRLNKYDMLLKNVLMDLLGGTNMKMLLQSMTGIDNKKLQSFDGLTHQQKATRMEWIVKELKENEVIPGDIFVDFRLFAMRHAEHVFDLLWRLVSHDIWFTWDRLEYLTTNDDRILCEVPFEWTPKPPPEKKKKKKVSYQKSFLSGFGGSSLIADTLPDSPNPFESPPESLVSSPAPSTPPLPTPPPPPYTPNSAGSLRSHGESESPPPPEPKHIRFPGEDFCRKFKKKSQHRPDPEECILEMVTTMLNSTREGRKLNVEGLDDLVDSRVLCELVNSFIPGTFTTEVLLNDRWTINLALKTFEKMIRINTPIDSSDLLEADPMAVCCAMCVYFMCGFKIRQAKAAINRLIELEHQTRAAQHDLDNLPEVLEDVELIKKRKMLKETLEDCNQERVLIESKFDVGACRQWWKHIETIQTETREAISKKMTDRFDQMTVPRAVSMNDLCISLAINLTLTQGSGFYLCKARETVTTDRRIVLKDAETGDFIDDFTHGKGPSKINIRRILGVSLYEPFDLVPSNYPQYELYCSPVPSSQNHVPVFRLVDLVSVYTERLVELSPDNTEIKVNSTRLKERLLLHCPYLKAVRQGRDVLLTYDTAIGDAIQMTCFDDDDSEALQLANAALIIRKQLFYQGRKFNGSLINDSAENTVPSRLLALVNMILDGPSIKSQTRKDGSSTRAARTISELIIFNSIQGNRVKKDAVRHNADREVPVPTYIGLKVHAQTRNRELIDSLHKHGLAISYDRVLKISSSIANGIINRFEENGVVCPPQLKKDLFTTGQVDNIDHNPTPLRTIKEQMLTR
nr:uncharacterized protein LOC129267773 [Lytechinus pictus]